MFIKNWKKEVFTIPNFLSLARLALIPIYISIYLNAADQSQYILAAAILTLSCLTDAVDGFIARKYNMISSLGKVLDPLADKLTQLSLSICLSMKYPVLFVLITLLLAKEFLQIAGAVLLVHNKMPLPSAHAVGKVSTFVLFVSLIGLILFPNIPSMVVYTIATVNCVCLAFAFITYYVMFYSMFVRQKHFPA